MYLKTCLLPLLSLSLVQAQIRYRPDCASVSCILATCWDGSVPPPSPGQCCPDLSLCKPDCRTVRCGQFPCPDGSLAPVPKGECCPDPRLCVPKCGSGCPPPFPCTDGSICARNNHCCVALEISRGCLWKVLYYSKFRQNV